MSRNLTNVLAEYNLEEMKKYIDNLHNSLYFVKEHLEDMNFAIKRLYLKSEDKKYG